MLDPSQNMIVIGGKIRTCEISSCRYDAPDKYRIVFAGCPKEYTYRKDKVLWLRNPAYYNPRNYRLTHDNRQLTNVSAILKFRNGAEIYWHIRFEDGSGKDYIGNNLRVDYSCLADPESDHIFRYLRQIAAVNALTSDDGMALLSKQYDKVKFVSDKTVLATYLNPNIFKPRIYTKRRLIYPFGSNSSQMKAVQAAFGHSISVIQGPPGTGKTQTILNIIANILVAGGTVLVVSNNNSATDNVLEKLTKHELGFLAAPLGNSDNKQHFIETQSEKQYPVALVSWNYPETNQPKYLEQIDRQIELLNNLFAKQERLAVAKQELQVLGTEWRHYRQENGISDCKIALRRIADIRHLIRLWFDIQQFSENATQCPDRWERIKRKLLWMAIQFRSRRLLKGLTRGFFRHDISAIITDFHTAVYGARLKALHTEIATLQAYLAEHDATEQINQLSEWSMQYLKNTLYRKYGIAHRKPMFISSDFYFKAQEVLEEYPVVLSTAFSARNNLSSETIYDYVIMDEASQIPVDTGALALSCARNAVIVGDAMQLPNVITLKDKLKLEKIGKEFNISEKYDYTHNSFLESVCRAIPNVPQTMLKEHYRCHPKIIEFCNQRFYGGNLVIMTRDDGKPDVISAVKTIQGNHARGHVNQREIDVIRNEVMPALACKAEQIGIIAPYNDQVNALQRQIGAPAEIATVHKFQGREKDTIIMSIVDNQISDFADDANLLNVAVSRAKHKFCLVVTGNEQLKKGNISDLLAYIEYNNFTVTESKIRSIFDYLYKQYTEVRKAYLATQKQISEYDSENLTYAMIEDILYNNPAMRHLDVVCHLPLQMLIRDFSLLDEAKRRYAGNILTHVDFLIYNKASKQPVLVVETDGWRHHQEGSPQKARDDMKNDILNLYGIPCERLQTNGSNEKERIDAKLKEILRLD